MTTKIYEFSVPKLIGLRKPPSNIYLQTEAGLKEALPLVKERLRESIKHKPKSYENRIGHHLVGHKERTGINESSFQKKVAEDEGIRYFLTHCLNNEQNPFYQNDSHELMPNQIGYLREQFWFHLVNYLLEKATMKLNEERFVTTYKEVFPQLLNGTENKKVVTTNYPLDISDSLANKRVVMADYTLDISDSLTEMEATAPVFYAYFEEIGMIDILKEITSGQLCSIPVRLEKVSDTLLS